MSEVQMIPNDDIIIIVDASVVAKWFFDEPLKDAADRLTEQHNRFIAPDLLVSEFINIVYKNTLTHKVTQDYGQEALKRFHSLSIHFVPAMELLEEAYQISCVLNHSAYDCIYLALSKKQGGIMVTADKPFYKKVKNSVYANHIAWIEDPPVVFE